MTTIHFTFAASINQPDQLCLEFMLSINNSNKPWPPVPYNWCSDDDQSINLILFWVVPAYHLISTLPTNHSHSIVINQFVQRHNNRLINDQSNFTWYPLPNLPHIVLCHRARTATTILTVIIQRRSPTNEHPLHASNGQHGHYLVWRLYQCARTIQPLHYLHLVLTHNIPNIVQILFLDKQQWRYPTIKTQSSYLTHPV